MNFFSVLNLCATIAGVAATPFKFPTPDGFPNLTPATLAQIEHDAGGVLPQGPLPTVLKPTGVTILQLLANNELFEVAYFTELLDNVTNSVPGYGFEFIAPLNREYLLKTLTAIVAQEKIHATGVNGLLAAGGQAPIAPCQYQFPVSTFPSAILLAQAFTDIALGTIPTLQVGFALDSGDELPLVALFSSVLGQEGEQVGFFRYTQSKTPSAAPQLTGGSASFAFTALHEFVVPGSCPVSLDSIPLTNFGKLNILTRPEARNMTLEYLVAGRVSCEENAVVYITGQNLPVTVPILSSEFARGVTRFTASFPFEEGFANGLTIAAVVNGTGSFATPDAVAAATLYGPGLIEVN